MLHETVGTMLTSLSDIRSLVFFKQPLKIHGPNTAHSMKHLLDQASVLYKPNAQSYLKEYPQSTFHVMNALWLFLMFLIRIYVLNVLFTLISEFVLRKSIWPSSVDTDLHPARPTAFISNSSINATAHVYLSGCWYVYPTAS